MITDENLMYEQIDKARENDGRYSGMTYEQGVADALEWVISENSPPMDEE